jgi:hypothetical protein
MLALLARDGISLADRATLHFGLDKAFLDNGDSERRFAITTRATGPSAG